MYLGQYEAAYLPWPVEYVPWPVLGSIFIYLGQYEAVYAYVFTRVGHPFFSKERNVLAFFSVLYKRTERF